MAKDEVKVSFCPKCKGFEVGYVFGISNLIGILPRMRCKDCGFEACSFPILVTTKDKLDAAVKSLKEKNKKKIVKKKVGGKK